MNKSLRVAYGEALKELGAKNDKVVVMDADLALATKTNIFAEEYPDRFYNMGIAESNLVCIAAGFAHSGLIPFISTFALFGAGRAYEQIRNSVSYVNANVKFGFTHSGLSAGMDGGSHQAFEDIALMRELPGMTIFVPCDLIETRKAVFAAAEINGPVYIRVGTLECDNVTAEDTEFIPGKANIMKNGSDVCIMATGFMVAEALKAAEILSKDGIDAAVVNFHTIKPIDEECILEFAEKCGAIVTVEEHSIIGGLGSAVAEVLAGNSGAKFSRVGFNDKFGKSGKQEDLFKAYGLTSENIVNHCKKVVDYK